MSDSNDRMKGLIISKPILYGNSAHYFGKKREEDGHTHRWTVYLRPYKPAVGDDYSSFIKKVHFRLHDSYPKPERIIEKPPYELTETGWGEFEMSIKLFFVDPQEKPLVINHLLKLFQVDTNIILGRKTLHSEFYDELCFVDPLPQFYRALTLYKSPCVQSPVPVKTEDTIDDSTTVEDYGAKMVTTLLSIRELQSRVGSEINSFKEQLAYKGKSIQEARDILDELENDTLKG